MSLIRDKGLVLLCMTNGIEAQVVSKVMRTKLSYSVDHTGSSIYQIPEAQPP